MADLDKKDEPTVGSVRDAILGSLPVEGNVVGSGQGRAKTVGDDEIVVFHNSGKKFSIKVKELTDQ